MEKFKKYKYTIIVIFLILVGSLYWFQVKNNSCDIKGNIGSNGEKIYHTIDCGSYKKTTINTNKGEKWFCTENEARDAGWRKALNCN